jgi:hypothetical protein
MPRDCKHVQRVLMFHPRTYHAIPFLPNMQVNAGASGRVVFSVDEYDAPHWPVVLLTALFLRSLQVALGGLQEPPTLLFPG